MSPEEVLAILSRKMQEGIATVGGQAAQVAQHAAQVAEDKVTVENYMQTAGESKKQALEAAERLKDSVNLMQKNTVDLQGKAPAIIGSATSYDGTPVEVNDSAEMPLQGLNVYGKSKQVTTTGANLFDANDVSKGYISDDSGNNIVVTNSYCSNFITVSAKTKYYLYSGQDGGRWGAFYDSSKTFILGIGPDKYNTVFETPENAAYVRFTVNYNNNNPDFARNVIFAKSTVALPFEPYTGGKPSPSPEYPQEIVSVGQKLITGKNLINADDYYSAYKQADGTYVSSLSAINKIKVGLGTFVGKQITISVKATKPSTITYLMIAAMINNTRVTSEQMWDNGVIKITVTPVLSTDYFWISYGSGSGEISISDIQVECGSEVTDYEPYTGGAPALYKTGCGVKIAGRNYVNKSQFETSYEHKDGYYYGVINTQYNSQKNFYNISDFENGHSYRFSATLKTTDANINGLVFEYTDGTYTKSSGNVPANSKKTISITSDRTKVIKGCYVDYSTGGINIYIKDDISIIDIDERSTSTVPLSNGLPGIPVTADGNYTDENGQQYICDEIDFSRGKYVRRVWQAEFDGSEDEKWRKVSTNYIYIECLPVAMNSRKGFCSQYIVGDDTRGIRIGNGNATLIIFGDFSDENALSNFKANLSANPFKVMTYLDTPIETDLTQEQLQAYKSLTTFKQTSIISNDAGAQMEVEYAADTKAYIDNKLQEIAQALVASASEAECVGSFYK